MILLGWASQPGASRFRLGVWGERVTPQLLRLWFSWKEEGSEVLIKKRVFKSKWDVYSLLQSCESPNCKVWWAALSLGTSRHHDTKTIRQCVTRWGSISSRPPMAWTIKPSVGSIIMCFPLICFLNYSSWRTVVEEMHRFLGASFLKPFLSNC